MSQLEEFRYLNERVKGGAATEAERRRWSELKAALIQSDRESTPAPGSERLRATR